MASRDAVHAVPVRCSVALAVAFCGRPRAAAAQTPEARPPRRRRWPEARIEETPRRTGAAAGRRGNNRERGNTAQSGADRVIPDACIDIRFARRARARRARSAHGSATAGLSAPWPVAVPRSDRPDAGRCRSPWWDAGRVSCGISTSFLLYTRTPHVMYFTCRLSTPRTNTLCSLASSV